MYNYETEKPKLITEQGQKILLDSWERIKKILHSAGAITMEKAMNCVQGVGDSWEMMAYIDRLKELGYLDEIPISHHVPGQLRTFWSKR